MRAVRPWRITSGARENRLVNGWVAIGLIVACLAFGLSAWRWSYAYGLANYRMFHEHDPEPGSRADRRLRGFRWVAAGLSGFFIAMIAAHWI